MDYFQEAKDYGDLRKEFFTEVVHEIRDKYFLNGVKHSLENDYCNVGTILGEVTSDQVTSETSKMFETSIKYPGVYQVFDRFFGAF